MSEITHVVFMKGEADNWGYASEQIALELEQREIDTYFVDYQNLIETLGGLTDFAVKGHTALVTFNFLGLSEEIHFYNKEHKYVWQAYDMRYLNILTDHPMFFDKQLRNAPQNMLLFCADRDHVKYVQYFYPEIKVYFLPTAGHVKADINLEFLAQMSEDSTYGIKYRDYERIWNYEDTLKPLSERSMDVVFTDHYVPLENLFASFTKSKRSYEEELHEIMDAMYTNPRQSFDFLMLRRLKEKNPAATDEQIRVMMGDMSMLGLCIRIMLRDEILRKLIDSDIRLHVFGSGWESFECSKPQNLIRHVDVSSPAACVEAVRDAKISLNVLPMMADGAHERVFTAMLQKTVALTDHSAYLDDLFKNELDLAFYNLANVDGIVNVVKDLLQKPEKMQRIAECGYKKAIRAHTWRERAEELMKFL